MPFAFSLLRALVNWTLRSEGMFRALKHAQARHLRRGEEVAVLVKRGERWSIAAFQNTRVQVYGPPGAGPPGEPKR